MRPERLSRDARRISGSLFTILVLGGGSVARAEDPCAQSLSNGVKGKSYLACMYTKGEIGWPDDSNPSVADLKKAVELLPELEDTSRQTNALDVMNMIHAHVVPTMSNAISKECQDEILGGLSAINDEILRGKLTPPLHSPCSGANSSSYQPSCWELDVSAVPNIPALPTCSLDVHDDLSFEGSSAVLRLATVVRDALGGYFAPVLGRYHAEAIELRGQWWTYFHSTRSQYPWEVLANGAAFGKKIKDTKGQFHMPPTHQWILAHPDAVLEYFEDAPDGEELKPGLSVEIVGINCWKWKGEKAARAIGGAIVANYSDVSSVRDWRFGGVIHVAHRYSFGATRASGDTGYFVSADLATLIRDKEKKAKQFLKQLKDTP